MFLAKETFLTVYYFTQRFEIFSVLHFFVVSNQEKWLEETIHNISLCTKLAELHVVFELKACREADFYCLSMFFPGID